MRIGDLIDVDPRTLRLPGSRAAGADPIKLQRQIAKYGKSTVGMPPPFVARDKNGELMLEDGVTRATRVAKLLPGTMLKVQLYEELNFSVANLPLLGDRLP